MDLSVVLSKLALILPFLSHGIATMHRMLDMFASYMGFDIGQNGNTTETSEEDVPSVQE